MVNITSENHSEVEIMGTKDQELNVCSARGMPPEMVEYKYAVFILTACFVLAILYFNNNFPQTHSNSHINYAIRTIEKREISELISNYKGTEAFLIKTPGCNIPNYGKKIVFKETGNLKRTCGQRAIFIRKIYVDWQKMRLVFIIDRDKLREYVKNKRYECCYSLAVRSNEADHEDSRIRYDKCKRFRNGSKAALTHEVIIVKCYTLDIKTNKKTPSILYEDAYTFVKKQSRKSMKYKEESWNVLLVGMDTMSRARIMTTMPKMVGYLKTQGWLDYRGYQKIGSNTFPNLVPMLTGKTMATLNKACSLGMHNCNNLMVWSSFRNVGYITAFGEDNLLLPDTFSKYKGFKTPPTHHYMRPFFLTGETQRGNIICAKHQPSGKHIFDYAYDFTNTYVREKFFGTFWINTFSHNTDYLPSLFENDTINFFEQISSTGILNNTFIMLISDHGIRYGVNRLQMEFYYEERLPMLFVWVPIEFRKMHEEKYYNLQLNQNRLVTPYDIYLTLLKISDMSSSVDVTLEACPLCKDLFKEKSPYSTCAEGGVSEKWCTCHTMKNADTFTDIDALNSLQLAVSYIQNYTLNVKTAACSTCRPLRLDRVFRIHTYVNQENKKYYVIAFQMIADFAGYYYKKKRVPTRITYEATVLKDNNQLVILDSVDTLSSYNSKGFCVKNAGDRGFCVCKAVFC